MANISRRVSDDDKKAVDQILEGIGLTFSSATNAFYKQIIRHQGIPFELKADPFYSKQNIARLERGAEEIRRSGGVVHEVIFND